ncbi:M14 family zinc carboxypeptidase, partial [Lacinutrix sp.]|uniref:M14 family zinc carboxypeptidase n=1 Tax=Lacinutrix sp. TaxID=1937692 RepID=UPI0025BFC0EE
MKKITHLSLLLFLIVQISFSQDNYKQVVILDTSVNTISKLANQGIDLRCGATMSKEGIILELSDNVLKKLDKFGINYSVKIEDMAKFYRERAANDMPNALSKLSAEKAKSQAKRLKALEKNSQNQNKSSIASQVLDNYLQDNNNPTEIDWGVPSNFNLGSMGGCLTVSETEIEMADMVTYGSPLNIISPILDASPSNETTYGNSFTNGGQYNTWSGQTVKYIRITGNQSTSPEGSKPQILFTSMIHARESASLMQNIYFMWYLLENYNIDPAIKNLVDNNELYFIPIVNPDGLQWNEERDPNGGGLQRKNLRDGGTNNSELRGVDVNRNFDYFWGADGQASGSSNSPTSDTYRGPNPFSEPESRILRDFVLQRNFKTVLMHHTAANGIPHPYGGEPTEVSGREDEMHKWHEDMTKYNRYVSGATIFNPANGIADDWMLGGAADGGNGTSNAANPFPNDFSPPSIGSGQNILASTPEHGHSSEGGSGGSFWPAPSNFIPISKRAVRLNLMNIYYGGKYAKLQDLTQSDINTLTSNLQFGIERLGQTDSDFTLTLTPISSNIASITSPPNQSGMVKLEQRNITASLTLNSGIQPNDKIEYKAQFSNGDGVVFYEVNYEKYYQPNVLLADNPDTGSLANWTVTGGWTITTATPFSGSRVIKDGTAVPYANGATKTLTTANAYDFSSSDEVLVQFYTKWDLERNYDFVELLASTDGTNWFPVDGNYNKPNAVTTTNDANFFGNKNNTSHAFQNNNSSGKVYDGDQMDKYVMEEIVINANNNSFLNNETNVRFRFRMRTDANNGIEIYNTTFTGFFIDDFKIIEVQIPCDNSIAPIGLTVNNTTTTSASITWNAISSATYDLRYREIGAPTWTEITNISTNSYNITGITDDTDYEVQVATRCLTTASSYSTSETFTTATIIPCTGSSITSYPYTETFNAGLGLWTQGANDIPGTNYEDWTLNAGGTVSGGTGPTDDFTGNGNYLYTEASNANNATNIGQNVTVTLISPCIDLTGHENTNFSFYYHMFGTAIGSISVDVSIDNGTSWSQLDAAGNIVTNTPILSGLQQTTQANPWLQQSINLSNYDGQVIKLRFAGTTGTTFSSDIAIDEINLTADAVTGSVPPTAVCQNINALLDNTGNATIVASDIDGGSTDDAAITNFSIDINTFNCSNIGTPVTVTLTVEDADGQTDTCTASVTVLDEVDPEFVNLPGNVSLTCGANNPTWTNPTATDNCDTTLTVIRTDSTSLNSGDTFPTGITIISYSVTDDSGNTQTASFNINIVSDTVPPNTITQNITVQLDATGNATITPADINNGSSDNCGVAGFSLSNDTFDCSNIGTNNVILTVTDGNGNSDTSNATITITQQDTPTPINCWDNFVYNTATCLWDVTGTQPEPPTTACYETATFNTTTCVWDVTG